MKTKPPSSVMSSQLKALLGDPESDEIVRQLIEIIASAPDAAARRERTIAIQAMAEITLKQTRNRN